VVILPNPYDIGGYSKTIRMIAPFASTRVSYPFALTPFSNTLRGCNTPISEARSKEITKTLPSIPILGGLDYFLPSIYRDSAPSP